MPRKALPTTTTEQPAPELEPKKKKATKKKAEQSSLPLPEAIAMPADIITSIPEAVEALRGCQKIGLDLETGGLEPNYDPIAVISMRGDNGQYAILHLRGYIPPELREFLEEDRLYVIHNGANFDVPFLWAKGIMIKRFWDTLTMEALLDMQSRRDKSKSLKASVARRLKQTVSKDLGEHTWMQPTLTPLQYNYCKEDVEYLLELQEAQAAKAHELGMMEALKLELEVAPAVAYMVLNGLPVDPELWDEYVDGQRETAKKLAAELNNVWGAINLDSWQQVKKAYAFLGVEVAKTDKEAIEEVASSHDDPAIRDIATKHLEFKLANQRVKLYGEYKSKGKLRGDRLHPNFWQCGTDTLRFSSSDPNGQNFARDMRRVFRAKPGRKVVGIDYSAIEARIAFMQAHDKAGIKACSEADIHSYVAAMLFEAFHALDKPNRKNRRQQAKASLFRFIFGGGHKGLPAYARAVYKVDISQEEARSIREAFFAAFPALHAKVEAAYKRAAQGGAVKLRLPHGAIRLLAGAKLTATRLLNTAVQGTAGAGMKYGLAKAAARKLHQFLVATVHDELVADVPEEISLAYAVVLGRCMIEGMYEVVRPEMPIEVGIAIRDDWSKDTDYTMGPDYVLRYGESYAAELQGQPVPIPDGALEQLEAYLDERIAI